MAREQGHPLTDPENGNRKTGNDGISPETPTPFLSILFYVLGFMAVLALLAWAAASLLRRF
ncbi:MAG TPA: hypothetical protein VGQ32_03475 [Thermoanaerobaculia bacterium]|jgi:hypothetical protein|nr:hypothetical protein [Thermoanaerobaculia bacterium]